MLTVELKIRCRDIGRIEITNTNSTRKNGDTRYLVTYQEADGDRNVFEFELDHKRSDGAFRLVEKVCRVIRRKMATFYSIPKDKIKDGSIKCKDIPHRYHKALGKFLGAVTGTYIDGEVALFVSDIEGFLRMKRTGIKPLWD